MITGFGVRQLWPECVMHYSHLASISFPDLDILVSPWVIDNSCFLLAYLLKALVFLICIRVSCIYDRKSLHLYSLLRTR